MSYLMNGFEYSFTIYDPTLLLILLNSVTSLVRSTRRISRLAHHYITSRLSKDKAAQSKGGEKSKSLISGDLHSGSNEDVWAILSAEVKSNLSRSVVSIALSDGNTLIYACSGIAIQRKEGSGTIFLTSARLVRAFCDTEEVYHKLKIEVRHEGNEVHKGYLAKYDLASNFAVVYIMASLNVYVALSKLSWDVLLKKQLVAVGRNISGVIMAKSVTVAGYCNSNRSEDSKEIGLFSEVRLHYDTSTS